MPGVAGILVFDDVELLDWAGPDEFLSVWGKHFGGPEKTVLISQELGVVKCVNGRKIISDHDFTSCPKLDYLIIPGGMGTRKEVDNEKLINFIKEASKNCTYILSVCTGAFLLREAGLLDGKKATTHWASLNRLSVFPKTTVIEKRIVRDKNIWTSSGVSAGMDLILAFIAHVSGKEVAGKVQAYTEYFARRKRYGDFHKSKEAPQYLKCKKKSDSRKSFSLFPSTQNLDRQNVTTGSSLSAQTTPNNMVLPRAKL